MPTPYRVIKENILPVTPEKLWDLLSNTEHLNRMIGLPAVTYSMAQEASLGSFRWAEAKIAPFGLVKWREFPFDWLKPKFYRVRRIFSNGPFTEVYGGIDIEPAPEGALLRVLAEFTPRHLLGRLVVSTVANKAVNDTLAYCGQALVQQESGVVLTPPQPDSIILDRHHLASARERLGQIAAFPKWDVERIIYLLERSSDEMVLGMKPFALADEWQLNRRELLRLFLYATRAGMFELEWQLMCPVCRVSKERSSSLAEVKSEYHCDFCGVDIKTDLERSTELRFNVSPTIRRAEKATYCLGGPIHSPHILVQYLLESGETRSVPITLPEQAREFRLRVLRRNHMHPLTVARQEIPSQAIAFTYDGEAWSGPPRYFAPDKVIELTITNASPETIVVVFEDITPDDQAVTAAFVTMLPEFRSHFSAEVLSPGREMALRRVCVLFTDLKGSTALYEEVGDAPALGRVHRHFDFLKAILEHYAGGVVKTMGDAVMAVFYYAEDAMHAALEIQSRVASFNTEQGFDPPLEIKIGIFQGPALVVNANGQIDYFGRTINIASRVQNLSEGGDILCAEEVFLEPGVEAVWRQYPVTGEAFQWQLKGIAAPMTLYRLRLNLDGSTEPLA